MQGRALEIVGRCEKCYGDSPKAYKKEQIQRIQQMKNVKSEYQEAYKEYLWRPRTQSMKPHEHKISSDETNRAQIERKTTYGLDFVYHKLPKKRVPKKYRTKVSSSPVQSADDTQYIDYYPKKSVVSSVQSPKVDNAKVIHPSNSEPLQSDTIYNIAYPFYDIATMTASQQSPIKGKDCIGISSNQSPPLKEVKQPEKGKKTEQKDSSEENDAVEKELKSIEKDSAKFEAISTAMADFVKPEGFERPVPCPPPVYNHFSDAKFDDATTFSMAYKPFPVQPYELPIWAKKPKYKRPEGGMVVNSLYMHDFQPPKVIKPPSPIDPRVKQNRNVIIRKDISDVKFEKTTTYKHDFQKWENVRPRETYQIIEVYQPPKEKMMFETNQRSHFKGEKADKMKPCRHISQHRELNTQTEMTFVTTYDETYRPIHPKLDASGSAKRRSSSAKQTTRTPQNIPRPATTGTIPKPDLSKFSISSNLVSVSDSGHCSKAGDTTANNSGSGLGHVDILKIEHVCDKCNKNKMECSCEQKM